jgi:ATP-binding cassette subfamily B protein
MGYLTGPQQPAVDRCVGFEVHAAADRLFEIMDLRVRRTRERSELDTISRLEIRFENVSFAYPGRPAILRNVNARFLPGEITALSGESGCGKSSILALLQRFYLPAEGRICFGQFEIRYMRRSSIRSRIAVVPQKIDLMSGTIVENIALGEFEPDMQRIINICAKAGVIDFIQSLPEGFETRLAENGRDLSGGQRQRLAIARALYMDAPIYLFDEPTAALDEISEKRFLNILEELRDLGKIVILVSHDSRLISFADRIYKVSNHTIEPESVASRGEAPRRGQPCEIVEGVSKQFQPRLRNAPRGLLGTRAADEVDRLRQSVVVRIRASLTADLQEDRNLLNHPSSREGARSLARLNSAGENQRSRGGFQCLPRIRYL